jgi:hypothetical protein
MKAKGEMTQGQRELLRRYNAHGAAIVYAYLAGITAALGFVFATRHEWWWAVLGIVLWIILLKVCLDADRRAWPMSERVWEGRDGDADGV